MIRFVMALGGCALFGAPAVAQSIGRISAPAEATAPVRAPNYSSVISGVKPFRVVEPKDWRSLNTAAGPSQTRSQPAGNSLPGKEMDHSTMPGMKMDGMPTGGSK